MRILLAIFIAVVFFANKANAQISKGLYNLLPNNTKPKDINHLTSQEIRAILNATDDFSTEQFAGELHALAIFLRNESQTTTSARVKIDDLAAIAFFYVNYNDSSLFYNKELLRAAGSDTQYYKNVTSALTEISTVYYYQGKYDSAINNARSLLDMVRAAKDTQLMTVVYNVYGGAFAKLQLFEKAIFYDRLGLELWDKGKLWNNTYVKGAIGLVADYVYSYEGKRNKLYADSALMLLTGIMTKKKDEAGYWFRSCYYFKGLLAYFSGDYQKAIVLLDSSMLPQYNIASQYGANYFYGGYLYKGVCLAKTGHYAQAQKILNTLAIPAGNFNQKQLVFKTLSEVAQAAGNTTEALDYFKKYKLASDSFNVEGQQGRVFEAEEAYQAAQQKADIAVLESKNLRVLQASNKTIAISVIAVLVLAITALLLYMRTKRQQLARMEERQKLEDELLSLELRMENERLLQNEREEQKMASQRKAISINMHDAISSSLAAFCFLIKNMLGNAKQEETRAALGDLVDEADSIYAQTRDFMHSLHKNENVPAYDLVEFLDNLCITFGTGSSLQIETEYDKEYIEDVFTTQQHAETYLFVKEAVTNCMKHSGASLLFIKTFFDKDIFHIHISDNGKGISSTVQGMGLESMRKRIQALGGEVNFYVNNGFNIKAEFPVG